ncbi:hypothetical protein H7170_01780 [Candidatus Gracilibacteria bacterium]|nr:hypothetical protein [Candidatus Gracilibacteria bacterium]
MKLGFYIVSILFISLVGYLVYTNSPFLAVSLSRLGVYPHQDSQGVPVSLSDTVVVSSGATGTILVGDSLSGVVVQVDKFLSIQDANPLFAEAIKLSRNQDFTGSLDILNKIKQTSTSIDEKSIVDFNISINKFFLDRIEGTLSYIDLSKETSYPPRIRALALQRIYLMYRKYNDTTILRKAVDSLGIVWISEDQAKLEYMKKAYEIYPLPGSALLLMQSELNSINNRNDALAVYKKYKINIDRGISEMQKTQGELTEATSAMLYRAQKVGNLYRDYAISSREEVESLYKDLIQFDQDRKLTINKQYALVYYANFLADIGDNTAAESILSILLADRLEAALVEGLPKTKDLTALRSMNPITDKSIQVFIDFLGPIIK